jgi:hypothetical protein
MSLGIRRFVYSHVFFSGCVSVSFVLVERVIWYGGHKTNNNLLNINV